MSKILIIGVVPRSLINFRGDLIKSLVTAGHDVVAMAAEGDVKVECDLASMGIAFRKYAVDRSSMNPLKELKTARALRKALDEVGPDLVLAYTIKPIIWCGIALRMRRTSRFFALIEGLGYSFQGENLRRGALRQLVAFLYRIALRPAEKVLFLNSDNQNEFIARGIVASELTSVVDGAGVNTDYFAFDPPKTTDPLKFLMISRLLGEKGVIEYAAAAKVVKTIRPDVEFHLLGSEETSPDRIPLALVMDWDKCGLVKYSGPVEDVRSAITACDIYVLPSYHEGMPRTILEAMAIGRPIITTMAPGCKETVIDGYNGFLVPVANPDSLAERMLWFVDNRGAISEMAQRSRTLAKTRFDSSIVNEQMFHVMGLASPRE